MVQDGKTNDIRSRPVRIQQGQVNQVNSLADECTPNSRAMWAQLLKTWIWHFVPKSGIKE
jgi:hypothetical protein